MDNEKRNQYIIIGIIGVLLLVVIGFVVLSIFQNKSEEDRTNVKFQQIYSSDYKLKALSDTYFIGSYQDNSISIIIDSSGKEIYTGLEDILYDGIYMLKDGNYLIYSNRNNTLKTYIFDGKSIRSSYKMDDISDVVPLLYTDGSKEYILGFISDKEEGTSFLPLDNTGFIVFSGKKIVADRRSDEAYYTYNEEYLVAQDSTGLFGVVDKKGDIVVEFKYQNIINSYYGSFIAQNEKDKYGILDKNGKLLVKFNYKVIDGYKDYYLVVNTKNKMALFDKEYQNLTGFVMEYDDLLQYDFRNKANSIQLDVLGSNVIVANNVGENLNGTEYYKHNLYVINKGKIIKTIKEYGYDLENVFYTLDKDSSIHIYDDVLQEVACLQVDDLGKVNQIKYVSDAMIKIEYVTRDEEEMQKYFNLEGKEVENEFGEFVLKVGEYSLYRNEDETKISLYKPDFSKVDEIRGSYIEILKDYIIVDTSIYKIVVS